MLSFAVFYILKGALLQSVLMPFGCGIKIAGFRMNIQTKFRYFIDITDEVTAVRLLYCCFRFHFHILI